MAEDNGKEEEEKFDFTSEGEGYISLAEARVLAVRTAVETPGNYGLQYQGVAMAFEVADSGEDEDFYTVTLSFRPQGSFDGTPGQEQFVIGKDGTIAVRQVLSSIVRKGSGFPVIPVSIGLVVVGIIAVVGAVLALSGSGGDGVPIAVVVPTETPAPAETAAPIEPTVDIEKTIEAGVQRGLAEVTPVPVAPAAKAVPTTASSSGHSFKFQYACINRTLDPCELLAAPGGMVERIFERTNGQVEIQISSFPELGLAGPDTLRLVADGTLGMVEVYSGYIGGDLPIVDVANLWGVISDIDTNWKTIDAVSGPIHAIIEERSNSVVLAESYYGNNYFYASEPLRSPSDFSGMKIRSHSTVLGDLINGMGADAQFVAFSEVYTALERGILDAAVTCGPCGAGLRWFEVADYLNGPIISIAVTYITINKDRWDAIPADLQAIMKEEAWQHQAENRRLVEDVWDPAGITDNVAGGMEHVPFSQELKDALKQASIDVVIPNWVDRNGGPRSEAVTMFNDLVGPIVGVTIQANGKAVKTN